MFPKAGIVLFAASGVLALLVPVPARAQQPPPQGALQDRTLPPVVTRDSSGEITVHAVRTERPITLDGRLDEEIYSTVDPTGNFVQQEPHEGTPATEPTDIWVLFDDRNLYIAARCWDSHPEREVATELRRDSQGISGNEHLAFVVDTFRDRRNGFFFQTTPLGAVRDQAIIGEAQNDDWNTVWDVRSSRFEKGWTTEISVPFKSLRYMGSGPQVWGINFRRTIRWKNEITHLTPVSAAFASGAINRVSIAATLVGLETPAQSMNLELKPFAVSALTTDRAAPRPFENDVTGDVGFDFKYGLTRSLIADVTVNTDFAQVEEDVQQVNLTRFSLFFPEKRYFFLEGQGIFAFGGVQFGNGSITPGDVPVMFFSRRIGLSQGQAVPVVAGGRLTGKAGRLTLGALNIQTADKEEAGALSTNFTAARLKWDFLRRSNFGVIATSRTPTVGGSGTSVTVGADLALLLLQNIYINSYYARTETPGIDSDESSYRAKFEYGADRYGLVAEHLTIGKGFSPEVGFVRRPDLQRNFGSVRFSPRPRRGTIVRKLSWEASVDYVTDARRTTLENRELQGTFQILFENGDQFNSEYTRTYELIPSNFTISPGVVVPAGGYRYETTRVSYNLGQQRKLSGRISAATGTFYAGRKTEASYGGRLAMWTRFAVEPSVSWNRVELPFGNFTARLVNSRFIVTPTPRMLISSLIQFNVLSHSLNSSVRWRWEYVPGSELFVVYSDGRDTSVSGLPAVLNRTLALKVTRLLRF
jgi:hypothetical protein